MYDSWALTHSLMMYSPRNWPMPWNLSGNFLMRSSVDLIGTVFLGVGGTGVGPGRWEVSWVTMTAQFILTTSNLLPDGSPRMTGPGMSATYKQEFIWWGCARAGTRLPDNGPMKWSKEGYLGAIVGNEPSVAHIKASWVTCSCQWDQDRGVWRDTVVENFLLPQCQLWLRVRPFLCC